MTPRRRAQSITELCVGLIALVPVILILIDVGTLYIGSTMNSDICRSAARAAANGPPDAVTSGQPKARALAVVNRERAKAAGNVSVNLPIRVWEQVRQPLPQRPFGGAVDGEVMVETSVTVRPPFLVGAIVPNGVPIKCRQTYPYTWVMKPDDLISGSFGGGSTGNSAPQDSTGGQTPSTGGHQPSTGGSLTGPSGNAGGRGGLGGGGGSGSTGGNHSVASTGGGIGDSTGGMMPTSGGGFNGMTQMNEVN